MAEDDAPLDLDRLVDEIRAEVEARTSSGEYSAALDEELRSRVVPREPASGPSPTVAEVDQALALVAERAVFGAGDTVTSSSLPGGAIVHRVAELGGRRVRSLRSELDGFGAALVPALRSIAALAAETGDDRSMRHELDTVQDRLAELERTLRHVRGFAEELASAQRDLDARLDRLERGTLDDR